MLHFFCFFRLDPCNSLKMTDSDYVAEPRSNVDWKIFQAADAKLSHRGLRNNVKTYEEFLEDKLKARGPADDDSVLAETYSSKYKELDDDNNNFNVRLNETGDGNSSIVESDNDFFENNKTADEEDEYVRCASSDSWETVSSCSTESGECDEVTNEDFLPYRPLADCLIRNYYPETNPKSRYDTDLENVQEYLPLHQKLPIMQALDALEDINKVLRVGKLTPRMERIMEYKLDYPFRAGYDEEGFNCCQWILRKLAKVSNKFYSTQWPN